MVTVHARSIGVFVAGMLVAVAVAVAFEAWRVDASPGETDATFMPITPCRLIDTRPGDFNVGPHTTFGPADTKTIAAHGDNGDCSIATDAVGLLMNVTAVDATEPTFLTIWPGGERPDASSLNPSPGQPPTPNAVATELSGTGSFEVFNFDGSVNVIIDVTGVYVDSSLIELNDRLARAEAGETHFNNNGPDIMTRNNVLLTSVGFNDIPYEGTIAVTATTDITAPAGNDISCQIRGEDQASETTQSSVASLVTTLGSSTSQTITTTWRFLVEPTTEPYTVGIVCGVIGTAVATYSGARLTATYAASS